MKLTDVQIGGRYLARIRGVDTTVTVVAIKHVPPPWHDPDSKRRRLRINVTIESSGQGKTLASAARLRPAGKGA